MTLLLREGDIRRSVTAGASVDAIADALATANRTGGIARARSTAMTDGGWLRTTSGSLPELDLLGFKAFHLVPGVGARYLTALYRLSTGEPLALLDGNHLTVARTSAAAAAAARQYFGERPITVGVIGSGAQARDGLLALAAACRVAAVRVYSRSRDRRQQFAAEHREVLAIAVCAVASAREATADADMVLCATQTPGTVALGDEDVAAPDFISSISSTLPAQRELDARVIVRAARLVIDTPDALHESGDLLAAAELGMEGVPIVELGTYLCDSGAPRVPTTVYKSIGSVEQDLAIAHLALTVATRLGLGERVEPIEGLKTLP